MEFSELFDGTRAIFSPNGKFLACACGDYVDIRYGDTLLKAFKFECSGLAKAMKWSCDSTMLLCQAGTSSLKLFSVFSGACTASLKEQTGTISQVSWASDFRTVLFMDPILFRVGIWGIADQFSQIGVKYIENVQPWAKPSFILSPNGKHLAVAVCGVLAGDTLGNSINLPADGAQTDQIVVFSAITWRKEKVINLGGMHRVGGIAWSPNSNTLVVWPNDPPDAVLFICVRSAAIIGKWQSSAKLWPGVNGVRFSPSAQFVAIIGKNSQVYIINCIAWCEELELLHNTSVHDSNCKVYQENFKCDSESSYILEVQERPVSISFLPKVSKTPNFFSVVWSSGGRYLASCGTRAPAVVWIWSAECSFKLCCVIVTKQHVQDFQWDPVNNMLAVVDGQDNIVLWNGDSRKISTTSVCTPASKMLFEARHLNWRFDGKIIVTSSDQSSTILELPSFQR